MRLEVTRKSDLAVRALHILADANDRIKGPRLADLVGSSSGFVSQVMTPLVRAGWVHSEPGPQGGYSLSTDLDELSILEVIEAIEGATDSGRCVLADRLCESTVPCALHSAWRRARDQLLGELQTTTIAEVAAAPGVTT